MNVNYLCPHCRGAINALENIILAARKKRKNTGLVLLHEDLGNYKSSFSATLVVEPGDIVDFFCPLCHKSLNTRRGIHFAYYIRIDESGNESKIVISRMYGEKATFKIEDGKAVESYGECARKYIDPEWFIKE
ncbi:MAG TPA: hypothetical protein PKH94_10055 [Bacteroidales bacterium]|nr:hypothetical protein [Bacteroidales bacterium]HNS47573.1 hypothetical protein [Bacteroidales bacterium]